MFRLAPATRGKVQRMEQHNAVANFMCVLCVCVCARVCVRVFCQAVSSKEIG